MKSLRVLRVLGVRICFKMNHWLIKAHDHFLNISLSKIWTNLKVTVYLVTFTKETYKDNLEILLFSRNEDNFVRCYSNKFSITCKTIVAPHLERTYSKLWCLSHALPTKRKTKWSIPLRIFSVNVTKSAGNCRFSHI